MTEHPTTESNWPKHVRGASLSLLFNSALVAGASIYFRSVDNQVATISFAAISGLLLLSALILSKPLTSDPLDTEVEWWICAGLIPVGVINVAIASYTVGLLLMFPAFTRAIRATTRSKQDSDPTD